MGKRVTKNALENTHYPMIIIRGRQSSRLRQENMEIHGRQRQLARHKVNEKSVKGRGRYSELWFCISVTYLSYIKKTKLIVGK